jgi:hypothetical protein
MQSWVAVDYAARACAIVTGLLASVTVAVSLTWWSHPAFGPRVGGAVMGIAFVLGLFGWFLLFGFVMALPKGPQSVIVDFFATWKSPRFLLLWAWLAFVVVVAVVQAEHGASRVGPWGTLPAGTLARFRWALTKDHDAVHMCVSHARWLAVDLNTARIFIGFATVFLVVACAGHTTLSRYPRRPRKRPAHRTVQLPTQSRLPFPPPPPD